MKLEIFRFNPFMVNTYVIFDKTKECVIIDPGMCNERESNFFFEKIEELGFTPKAILNTHLHADHIAGVVVTQLKYNIPFCASKKDMAQMQATKDFAVSCGFPEFAAPGKIDRDLKEGDVVEFGESKLRVLETPGHTMGGLSFVGDSDKFVICGDTLFKGTIGRTDLEGGDYDTIISSIKNKLLKLPEEYIALCGHGEETQIGLEATENPIING